MGRLQNDVMEEFQSIHTKLKNILMIAEEEVLTPVLAEEIIRHQYVCSRNLSETTVPSYRQPYHA